MNATTDLKKIAEGREAEIFAWGDGAVLRLSRDGRNGGSIEREKAAMDAVRSVVPLVPAVLGMTEVMGRPGLIMERVDGPNLNTLAGRKPWKVWQIGSICGAVHARLHDVIAPASVPSLRAAAHARLPASPLVPPDVTRFALREVDALPDGDRLLHGDFHPGNILLSSNGPIVIDWPNVRRGDPHADVGRTLLMLRVARPPGAPLAVRRGERFARGVLRVAYLRAYRRRRPLDDDLLRRWQVLSAADRLAYNIREERQALLQILESAMADDRL